MKAAWERSTELVRPDIDTIRRLLSSSFLKEEHIESTELLSGGLNNSNIKLTTHSNQSFVLRIYNKRDSMEIERQILHLLIDKAPIPEVLYADSTCSVLAHPFLVLSWVEGEQFSELIYRGNRIKIESAAREVGQSLAGIHKIEFSGSGFFDEKLQIKESVKLDANLFLMLIEESLVKGYGKHHLGKDLCHRIIQFSQQHAHLIDHLDHQNSLVHGDFNPLNIKVEENLNITVLDWEYAFSGPPLFDIGNMLRYESINNSKIIDPFISSYLENGGSLPAKWLQKAKLLDLIALCDLLNKEKCGEVRIRDIKSLILSTMEDWERYETVQDRYVK